MTTAADTTRRLYELPTIRVGLPYSSMGRLGQEAAGLVLRRLELPSAAQLPLPVVVAPEASMVALEAALGLPARHLALVGAVAHRGRLEAVLVDGGPLGGGALEARGPPRERLATA